MTPESVFLSTVPFCSPRFICVIKRVSIRLIPIGGCDLKGLVGLLACNLGSSPGEIRGQGEPGERGQLFRIGRRYFNKQGNFHRRLDLGKHRHVALCILLRDT